MKLAVVVAVSMLAAFLGTGVDAVAQELTEKDIQVDQPGLTVQVFLPQADDSVCGPHPPNHEAAADLRCLRWSAVPATDADGNIYFSTLDLGLGFPPKPTVIWRTRPDGTTERVIHADPRTIPSGPWSVGTFDGFTIDLQRGYLYVLFRTHCFPTLTTQECGSVGSSAVVKVAGLATLKPGHAKSGQ